MYVQIVGGPYSGQEVGIHPSPFVYITIPGPITMTEFDENPCLEMTHTVYRIPISPCRDVETGRDYHIALWDERTT